MSSKGRPGAASRRNLITESAYKRQQQQQQKSKGLSYYVSWMIALGIFLSASKILRLNKLARVTAKSFWTRLSTSFSSGQKASAAVEHFEFHNREYRSLQEQKDRDIRFPSVEERIRIYMSNWYVPPCDNDEATLVQFNYQLQEGTNTDDFNKQDTLQTLHRLYVREVASRRTGRPHLFEIHGTVETAASKLFYLQKPALLQSTHEASQDVLQNLYPWVPQTHSREAVPTLLDLADKTITTAFDPTVNRLADHPHVPFIKKFRLVYTKQEIDEMAANECVAAHRSVPITAYYNHLQPILWKLKIERHYGMLEDVTKFDVPYKNKKNKAVFRGRLSGIHKEGLTTANSQAMDDWSKCMNIPRCRLVLKHARSSTVDARLVGKTKGLPTRIKLPLSVLQQEAALGVIPADLSYELFADETMELVDMLRYKAIIMLEGNDVASGLKWALYSNSVVLMDPVSVTSWAMEERLQPWVHYVPIHPNATDVEERLQWVLDNPVAAERIAHRGSLWIKDLVYHPNAVHEEKIIYAEIMRRYQTHFRLNPTLY